MNAYVHYTPDSGTCELPRLHRGQPVTHLETTELQFPWFRPSVPTRVERPGLFRRLLGAWS